MSGDGLIGSARRLLATLLETLQVRLELAATEIELEKLRIFDALLIAVAATLGVAVGLVLLCAFIVVLAGEAYRLQVLAGLCLVFVGGGVWGLRAARGRLSAAGTLFEGSAAELARDRAALLQGDGVGAPHES